MNERSALKRLFKIVNGSTPKSDIASYWDGDIVWVTPEDLGKLESDSIGTTRRQISHEGQANCGASVVPAGSIVLSTRAPIGNVAIAQVPLCTNQGCKSLVPRSHNVIIRYFFYQVQALKRELNVLGNGTTFLELSAQKLGQVLLFAPSPERQKLIAEFLDHETAEADALIAKYERLIELLEEKRVALITQAVTKGLDPNVTMKDGGVDIGSIPAHWKVMTLARLLKSTTNGFSGDQIDEDPGVTVPVTRIETISNGTIDFSRVGWVLPSLGLQKFKLKPGDILFSHINSLSMVGKCAIYEGGEDLYAGVNLLRLRSSHFVKPEYLHLALSSTLIRQAVRARAKPAINQASINMSAISAIRVPLPPLAEQPPILSHVHKVAANIAEVSRTARRAIDLLNEHRSALTTAAVTGQIDVMTYRVAKHQSIAVPA